MRPAGALRNWAGLDAKSFAASGLPLPMVHPQSGFLLEIQRV
jgi:hypothetical protein